VEILGYQEVFPENKLNFFSLKRKSKHLTLKEFFGIFFNFSPKLKDVPRAIFLKEFFSENFFSFFLLENLKKRNKQKFEKSRISR